MKVMLLAQREGDIAWVADALDEYTWDEVGIPEQMQAKIDADPASFRCVWVQIPDDALDRLWDVPTVEGAVTDAP